VINSTVKGNISDYTFKLAIKEQEIKEVSIEEVNILFNTIFKIVIPQINTLLNDGIRIPPMPFFDLRNCSLTLKPNYMFLDIEPEPVKQDFEKYINLALKKLGESYKKVIAISKLRKERPASMPTWIKIDL